MQNYKFNVERNRDKNERRIAQNTERKITGINKRRSFLDVPANAQNIRGDPKRRWVMCFTCVFSYFYCSIARDNAACNAQRAAWLVSRSTKFVTERVDEKKIFLNISDERNEEIADEHETNRTTKLVVDVTIRTNDAR